MTRGFYGPLAYLLHQADEETRQRLIAQFSDHGTVHARLTVAEYLVQKDQIEEGLRRMINVIPLLEFNHATGMSISMWLTKFGDRNFKSRLVEEGYQAMLALDDEKCDLLIWAVSMMKWQPE